MSETHQSQADTPNAPNGLVIALDRIASSPARVLSIQALLAIAVYAVVIDGPLLFDDHQFITWNKHVVAFDLGEIYTSSVTEGSGFQSNTYRPNQQFVFAAIHQLFGTAPYPYHAFSILVHLANAFMVFALLRALAFDGAGSLLASLVFLLHPVQTQAVSYVSGLAGPLGFMFVLGAIHVWLASLREQRDARRFVLFAVSLVLCVEAFFTKSNMVIVFPLVLLLAIYRVLSGRETLGVYLVGSVATFGVFAFGYLAVKLTWLDFAGGTGMIEGYSIYTESIFVRIATFVSVLDHYLQLVIWPAVLSYTKPRVIYSNFATLHGALGLVIVAVGLFAAFRAVKWPALFLACGWFFATLAPFSGVIPLTSMYLEHWLYAPLVGVAIGLAALYDRADSALRNNIASVAVVVLLIFALRTSVRNYDWADPERFYIADMRAAGYTVQMLNNLATYQMSIDKDDAAIETLEFLIKGLDTSPEPHDNLAQIYSGRGEYGKAQSEFLRALEIDPANRSALIGLRDLYDTRGQTSEAMKVDQRIREIERDERL